MQKRLLILTDAPAEPLYLPRIRYLVKYLTSWGGDCTVVSEQMPGSDFTIPHCRHIRLPYYTDNKAADLCLRISDKAFDLKDKQMYRYISRTLNKEDYDIVLCSTFNTFPLPAAAKIAEKWHKPLIADIRDMAEQWGTDSYIRHPLPLWTGKAGKTLTSLYEKRQIRLRNEALKKARTVTTISPWHQQQLQRYNNDVRLIYNGYDEDDFTPQDIHAQEFTILYTGRIYDLTFRNPALLFETLRHLRQSPGQSDNSQKDHLTQFFKDTRLLFHIEKAQHAPLAAMAERYGLTDIVNIKNFVSNKEATDLLHRSSICLILTNQTENDGSKGVMTTKFFEALGVEKPVLCIKSDNDCLADAISLTHSGLAATNIEETERFILDKYKEWQTCGYTHQAVNKETKQLFTRRYQARQFAEILKQN